MIMNHYFCSHHQLKMTRKKKKKEVNLVCCFAEFQAHKLVFEESYLPIIEKICFKIRFQTIFTVKFMKCV